MELSGFNTQNPASLQSAAFQIGVFNNQITAASSLNNVENFAEVLKRAAQDTAEKKPGQKIIDKNDKLYELCLELETFLVKNLLTSMRNTVQKSGLIDDSFAGKMYEDMLYDEYAKDYAKNANFGLAEQAYRQLSGF